MFHLALQHDLWESVSSHQSMPGQNDTSWSEEERLYLFTYKDKDDKRNGRATVIDQRLGGSETDDVWMKKCIKNSVLLCNDKR